MQSFIEWVKAPSIIIGIILLTVLLLYLIFEYSKNPFPPEYYVIKMDISGKRKASMPDLMDLFLCEHHEEIYDKCFTTCSDFEKKCVEKLSHMWLFKSHHRKQFEKSLAIMQSESYPYFVFAFYRGVTKYQQQNYVRTSYVESVVSDTIRVTILQMMDILSELESIGYTTSREKYYAKDQRKLMTAELRQKIKERDNYTCQICGKVMLDEVGLHIDHIVPIKQGGKSVPENLQVLCSKCNLAKGSK